MHVMYVVITIYLSILSYPILSIYLFHLSRTLSPPLILSSSSVAAAAKPSSSPSYINIYLSPLSIYPVGGCSLSANYFPYCG